MKSLLKKWVIPPGIWDALYTFKKERKRDDSSPEPCLLINQRFKNMGKGKRAFLLATGPSINNEDLTLLSNEDCFTVSNFYLHDKIDIINPLFHFFAPYHEPLVLENYIEWLREADAKLPEMTSIFLGLSNRYLIKENNLFPKRKVYYMDLGKVGYDNVDLLKKCPVPATSPLMVMNLLLYMGYSKVYLLGCDHNTLRDFGKIRQNFYSNDKDIRKNATDVNSWNPIDKELEFHLKVFKSYREIIENNELSLINLSPYSWLNFIEFQSLREIMN